MKRETAVRAQKSTRWPTIGTQKIWPLRLRGGFTLVELLIVITIIGVLITLVTVAIGPVQKKSRDARRKADVNLFLSGINLFKSDFKVYPNYTFYLGSFGNASNGGANSNFELENDIPACNSLPTGATSEFATDPANINESTLKEGFTSVNHFLICLRYLDRLVKDPNRPDKDGYHYRVSYDYNDAIVSALLENTNDKDQTYLFDSSAGAVRRYYLGNGLLVRHLDDDSDTRSFFSALRGGTNTDGRYLYQCLKQTGGSDITRDNRVLFEPIVSSGSGWAANSACRDMVDDLFVARSW